MAGNLVGVAQQHFNVGAARALKLSLPPKDQQRQIGNYIKSYCDLIENYTCRIVILEEIARRIFEEWFVHFRAPGCESLPMVDSVIEPVPQGWELVPLESLCSRITDGAHHSPPSVEHGRPMLSVKDMRTWGFEFTRRRMRRDLTKKNLGGTRRVSSRKRDTSIRCGSQQASYYGHDPKAAPGNALAA